MDAVRQWRADAATGVDEAVIEIIDSASYEERFDLAVGPGQRLELRAADGTRPLLRVLDWHADRPEALTVRGLPAHHDHDHDRDRDEGTVPAPGGQIVLDGLLIAGRPVWVTGPLTRVVIRRCTLVPGWSLKPPCAPRHPEEASLILEDTSACVRIERSILGTVLVIADEVHTDPLRIQLLDSVLDATGPTREALSGTDGGFAHAELRVERTTVIGQVRTRSVRLAQDCLFDGEFRVARRGLGCVRFCYVPIGSRTPRRFGCQPDEALADPRLRPDFVSRRYGTPGYVRLVDDGPVEIARGASTGSQLGVFHDLFEPRRLDAVTTRLAEYAPLGTDPGVVLVT